MMGNINKLFNKNNNKIMSMPVIDSDGKQIIVSKNIINLFNDYSIYTINILNLKFQ